MIKRMSAVLLVCLVALMAFSACGGGSSSSSSAASTPSPSSSAAAPSGSGATSTPDSGSGSVDGSAGATPSYDMDVILVDLVEAAALGTTIDVSEIDLKAGGVDVENLNKFAGKESQLSAENGGIVIVMLAKDGTAETVAREMENFRDSRMGNEDYAEFENARTNTADARIKVFGNWVVYAVSATGQEGGWPTLDAAIEAAFAESNA